MSKKKIAVIILGVFVGVSSLSIGFSPSVRASVKKIFDVDNSGNIVEVKEDDFENINSTMVGIDDSNREELGKLLGFKISFPEKIGGYIPACNEIAGISVKNVKYKDADEVEDRIKNATDYNELCEDLGKEYEIKLDASRIYITKNADTSIGLGQASGDEVKLSDRWKVKDVKNIQGVECTIIEAMFGKGNEIVERGEDGAITGIKDDNTEKPTSVEKTQKVVFTVNGIIYDVMGFEKDADKNQADELAFAEEYIKILQNK